MSELLKRKLAGISNALNQALEKAYQTSAEKAAKRENAKDGDARAGN